MPKVFYMPCPDLFGVWKDEGLPAFNEEVSVFKFEGDGALASYSICPEMAAQRQALVGLRRWMSAVCAFDGFAPANTRCIKTVNPGAAERQADGSWKVKEKAFVAFET